MLTNNALMLNGHRNIIHIHIRWASALLKDFFSYQDLQYYFPLPETSLGFKNYDLLIV